MPNFRSLAGILAAIFTTLLIAGMCTSKTSRADAPDTSDFSGKAVFVHRREANWSGGLLNPRIRTFGVQSFLIGRPIGGPTQASALWIPLTDIIEIEEFADAHEMGKSYRLPDGAAK